MVVHDDSMRPLLEPGDRLLVDPRAYVRRRPAVGDVVVLPDPEDRRRLLVKRIAATGGDRMPIRPTPGDPDRVPEGHVFVLSDRREGGRDSRRFGSVPTSSLLGQVWHRYAPLARRAPIR